VNRLTSLMLGGVLAFASAAAGAQNTVRVRGTIDSLDGSVLAVRSLQGQDLRIQLTDKTGVAYVKALTFADLTPGVGLGTTAVARPDGTLVAREIHTFPPSLGVPNEGHRPTDDPGASMTNARISAVVQAAAARELTLTWKDGSRKLLVPDGTPIVTAVNADRSFLKPGEYVYLNAEAAADGGLTAVGRIQVSKDGVRPPQ
jgi:hypothetical protein